MSGLEIDAVLSDLAEAEFDSAEFAHQFLVAQKNLTLTTVTSLATPVVSAMMKYD
jgi:hypothetical protein